MKPLLLHVINSLGVGGAEILLAQTIRLLPEYRHILVTLGPGGEQEASLRPHLEAAYCLHALPVHRWPGAVVRLRQIIRRHRPTLVHAHLQIAGLITKTACPRQVPLFYSLHNPYSVDAFSKNRLALPLERLTARPYHHLIGVSRVALEDYQAHVANAGTGDVVHNMVSESFFTNRTPGTYRPGDRLRCVSVGNLKPQKNYLHSLQAFRLLRHLPISLDIYGAGADQASLAAFMEQEGLSQVRLMGKVNPIAELLPQYDLYLISSSYEGFGIAPLEAMAAGLPAIVSDIPVFREVIGDAAFYFGLGAAQELAALLQQAFEGALPLEAMAAAGQAQARRIAHPDQYRSALLSVYQKYL